MEKVKLNFLQKFLWSVLPFLYISLSKYNVYCFFMYKKPEINFFFYVWDEKNIHSPPLNHSAFNIRCSRIWPFNTSFVGAFLSAGHTNKEWIQRKPLWEMFLGFYCKITLWKKSLSALSRTNSCTNNSTAVHFFSRKKASRQRHLQWDSKATGLPLRP